VDTIPGEGLHLDDRDELGLSGNWCGGHDGVGLGSVGVVEWAGVVFTEPGVLKGVRVVNLVRLREEEPEVPEGFPWNELELGKGIEVGSGASKVGHQGVVRCSGEVGRSYGGCGVVEAGWHC
jgi:hypothetical protein